MTLQNYPEYQEILNNIRFSYEQLSSLLVRLQDHHNRGPRVENETFINEIFAYEILQLSDIRDEVKDVIRDGLNDILSRTYNTWYCNITQNLAVKINNLLETSEFRNWHSG